MRKVLSAVVSQFAAKVRLQRSQIRWDAVCGGLLSFRSISACLAAVLMAWLTTGGSAATQTARLSDSGDKNEGSGSSAVVRNNDGRSQTTIASLTSTTAKINVFGYGFAAPSGELSFTDITDSNPVAPPVTLNTATSTTTLLPQVATNTGANTLPVWTELADLNGDGILDLVTSLSAIDSFSVRLGNGNGTFRPATVFLITTGFDPGEVHAVSLRGNGTMDLIVASSATNQIAVLLGDGNGFFQPSTFYTVGSPINIPSSIASGDFNHDGNLDIAVANSVDNTVSIFLGNGSGSLTQSGTPINVGHNPESIRAGDFNSDGYSDLAVANFKDGTVTTLLNNQNGTFTASTISIGSGAGSGPRAVATTGSGSNLLLAVANFLDNTVSVMQSEGNGSFEAQTIVPVGRGPQDIRWTDINGDGIPDLVVANFTDSTLRLMIGGTAGYAMLGPFSTGGHPGSAAVGDLDGDGTPDIVVSNNSKNETEVFLSGAQISVSYTGLSLPAGNTVNATYTPDAASKYRSSTSPNKVAP
jgi:FG-GAP-like repeat